MYKEKLIQRSIVRAFIETHETCSRSKLRTKKKSSQESQKGFNMEVRCELALKRQVLLCRRDEKGEARATARMRTWMLEQAWCVQGEESFILCVAGQLHVR